MPIPMHPRATHPLSETALERELEDLERDLRSALAKVRDLRQVAQQGVFESLPSESVADRAHRRAMQAKELLTVPEAAELLSLSRTTIYELVANGAFPVIKIGRATRIPTEALRRWVRDQLDSSPNQP